jgi:hypothetical protein
MTPSAITPAARGAKRKPSSSAAATAASNGSATPKRASSAKRSVSHPSQLRRQTAPRSPRRVSGPLGGATAAPPARRRTRSRERPPALPASAPLVRRSAAFVRALPDHALLDRIIRGRAWIPLLGVLLAGIVAMQVEVLKLNAGIGRSLERGTALQSQNELLRAHVAGLADDQRIESMAAAMGMVMPAPASIKFLSLGRSAALTRALSDVHEPDAASFTSALGASTDLTGAAGATAGSAATGTSPSIAPSTTGSTPSAVSTGTSATSSAPAAMIPTATTSSSTGG